MEKRAERTDRSRAATAEKSHVDEKAVANELDLVRIELAKIGLHFAFAQSDISEASLSDYSKDLRAYGKALDRLGVLVSELLNRPKHKEGCS